jgi:hypothetical protein
VRGIITAVPIPDDEDEIVTAVPIRDDDDDSEFWELDSSESIPATGRSGRGGAASLAMAPAPATRPPGDLKNGIRTSTESNAIRPWYDKWVMYVAVVAAAIVGGVSYSVSYSYFSNAKGRSPKPDLDSPKAATATIADGSRPEPSVESSPALGGKAAHQEAIEALIRAYNDIADGYAQIGDAISIARGEERITRGVEQLKAAAQRGRGLPPLPAAERAALVAEKGPALIQAVDRVIQQIQRLKATPGIKSDFDRLIEAYTRTRQGIDREMNPQAVQLRAPNIPRLPAPPPFPPVPDLRPRGGRFRGRP